MPGGPVRGDLLEGTAFNLLPGEIPTIAGLGRFRLIGT